MPSQRAFRRQRGAALVVSMVILMVMTLIGITGMHTNILEEKMAGNYRDTGLAFQAAEAAVRDAEQDIRSRISGLTGFNSTCSQGLCDATGGLTEVWEDTTKGPNGVTLGTYTGTAAITFVACQPTYWIEGFKVWPAGSPSWRPQYRVTSVACGQSAETRIRLQTVFH